MQGEFDKEVLRAGVMAEETGRLTPLIKVELWAKIQSRRLSEGKEELNVEFPAPSPHMLTEEEEMKREERKRSNRVAAAKCRQRKKDREEQQIKILEELTIINKALKEKIKDLEKEKALYSNLLNPQKTEKEENDFLELDILDQDQEVPL